MWTRYVALGDSFTEGMDDPYADGTFRGWADLVAGKLASLTPDFRYANLAIRGRLFDAVVDEQVEPGLALGPDLVSFAAGGNDVLRRHCDPPALMERFGKVIGQVRDTGADVLVFRFADVMQRLPGTRMVAPRIIYLNDAVAEIAAEKGARLVDLWGDAEYANPSMWSTDRLHMSAAGHHRTAAHVLTALGIEPEPSWWDTPAWPGDQSWLVKRAGDVKWAGTHLLPWLKRRLTGKSSGDNIHPKRPTLDPLT